MNSTRTGFNYCNILIKEVTKTNAKAATKYRRINTRAFSKISTSEILKSIIMKRRTTINTNTNTGSRSQIMISPKMNINMNIRMVLLVTLSRYSSYSYSNSCNAFHQQLVSPFSFRPNPWNLGTGKSHSQSQNQNNKRSVEIFQHKSNTRRAFSSSSSSSPSPPSSPSPWSAISSSTLFSQDADNSIEIEEPILPQPPANDTIAINTVGTALSVDQQLTSAKSKAASEIILAIDPSTIEVVPFSDLAKEGEVFGGPSLQQQQQQQQPQPQLQPNGDVDTITTTAEAAHNANNVNTDANVQSNISPNLSNFVNMFRGSANYIANHRNTIVVYHIPGDLLDWDGFSDLMDDIALTWLLGIKPVIVIGCRRQINDRLADTECPVSSLSADGKTVECSQGDDGMKRFDSVRITDLETLRIVKEEAGFVRFEVERQLGRALHLHGTVDHNALLDGNVVSGNFYSAQPYGVIDGVDFMYTGYPRRFEKGKIHQVLDSNDVVLLTPLGASPSGEIFNVNTEHLAACVAGALEASKVIYFTNVGTAFREVNSNKLVQNLKLSDAKNLLDYNKIMINISKGFATIEHKADLSDGVVEAFVKTGWSIAALEKGVKRAHIVAPINGALLQELYTRDGSGTLISRDIYEGIRNANVGDVAGIYELIEPLVSSGYLVNRPKNVMERDIASYYVFTRDNLIIACAQLKLFENGYAEIGCMVVKKEYRSQGRGDAMLCFLERLSVMCGCPNVFVLSTQTMEWFVEHGYTAVDVDQLPPSRREVYNYERRSKIYMKKINNIRDLDAAELWWNR
jgi:amino-acid N-acetyltransferase